MRIVGGHGHLINELGTQSLDGASGREIAGVAGDRDRSADRADKGRNGSARLPCVAVTPGTLGNLKSNVTGANPNVLRISHPKIQVPDLRPIGGQDAEMEIRNKSTRRLARHHLDEPQRDLSKGQSRRRSRKPIFCEWRTHGPHILPQRRRAGPVTLLIRQRGRCGSF
jgi:hypothetical protein